MDNFDDLRDQIGVLAEIFLLFWNALKGAGADDDAAAIITGMFMAQIMEPEE